MTLGPPLVIDTETGIDHGTYVSTADMALCLAFAELDWLEE